MPTLVLNHGEPGAQVFQLRLGVNRVGRSPECDFLIHHPTVSAFHCDLVLADDGTVVVRDCGSTNGTFLDDQRITTSLLATGQTLRLGNVPLLVESVETRVAIPEFRVPTQAPPVVLSDGSLLCPRHAEARAEYQCSHCREVMCTDCVHVVRRTGGEALNLCPLCSHPCNRIAPAAPPKPGAAPAPLEKTLRLPLRRRAG